MKKVLAILTAFLIALLPCACAMYASTTYIDVSGLWLTRVADSEYTLFLRDDGTGSLQVSETPFSISWTCQGNTITLDQGGSTAQGVCDETYISLHIDGANLLFLRELPEILPLDSDLSGTWQAMTPGGDFTLILNPDNTAALQLGPDTIPFTWTHEDASVALNQDEFTIECTFDGTFINLFMDDGNMCFTRTPSEENA